MELSNLTNSIEDKKEVLKILTFDSYDEAKPFWLELNQSYKSNELTVDWAAHKLIWDHFYKGRGFKLNIIVGVENENCIGIFPLIAGDSNENSMPYWSLSEDFIIAREYFCPPDKIHKFAEYLPSHFSDDMSCFYIPEKTQYFCRAIGGVIDVKSSQEEYFQTLKKKARHTLKRTYKINADIEVVADSKIHWDKIQGVLKHQIDYWQKKNGLTIQEDFNYSRDKIYTDLMLMGRAEEMGKLISLYFYLKGELVATNFSVRREQIRVDDYLCLRNCQEEFSWRGLGIFAILKNIEHCRNLGICYYDLSSCLTDYKKKFLNTAIYYYFFPYDAILNREQSKEHNFRSLSQQVETPKY